MICFGDYIKIKERNIFSKKDNYLPIFESELIVGKRKEIIELRNLQWRINDNEWHNESINRKLWYKNFLKAEDLLEIDNPKEDKTVSLFVIADNKSFSIFKNKNGQFEVGKEIYKNENKKDISIFLSNGKEKSFIFSVATKEHFINNPLIYKDKRLYWYAEDTFIGDIDSTFFLIANNEGNRKIRIKLGVNNVEFQNFTNGIYQIKVKIKDKNSLSKHDIYHSIPIFESELLVGKLKNGEFRLKDKRIVLTSVIGFNAGCEILLKPKYFIDKLQFVQEEKKNYYSGRLCVIDLNGKIIILNTMLNEKNSYDRINPVRIELRENSTLSLVAGWQGSNDFIGNLFCDRKRKGICNIAIEDNLFYEINLYKYKEEEYV